MAETEGLVNTVHANAYGIVDLYDTILDTADVVADSDGCFRVSQVADYLIHIRYQLHPAQISAALAQAVKLHILQVLPYDGSDTRYKWVPQLQKGAGDAT